jgi:hypothetical protein
MSASERPVRTIPGKAVFIKVSHPIVPGKAPCTTSTILASFDSVKHLLSNKPLRRPNRTRPLS